MENRKPNISRVGLNETGSLPAQPDTYNPVKLLRGDVARLSERLAEQSITDLNRQTGQTQKIEAALVQATQANQKIDALAEKLRRVSEQNTQLVANFSRLTDVLMGQSALLEQINRQADKHYANLTIRLDKLAEQLRKTHDLLVQATRPEDDEQINGQASGPNAMPDIDHIEDAVNRALQISSNVLQQPATTSPTTAPHTTSPTTAQDQQLSDTDDTYENTTEEFTEEDSEPDVPDNVHDDDQEKNNTHNTRKEEPVVELNEYADIGADVDDDIIEISLARN